MILTTNVYVTLTNHSRTHRNDTETVKIGPIAQYVFSWVGIQNYPPQLRDCYLNGFANFII